MHRLREYLDFVKIEHTLFALPFAYLGAFLAEGGLFSLRLFILIALAFTGMRTVAMTLNRIIDREIDALNPRTANRHLPSGRMSLREAYAILIVALIVYFTSAYLINKTAFLLSPIPVITAYVYPYLKRFTCLCHFFLGLNLAFAPLGGWVAVKDSVNFDTTIILIAMAVVFWVAGFDIIYALQDLEFDRKYHLHSIGAHFGVKTALILSKLSHVIFYVLIFIALIKLDSKALLGLIVIGLLLIYEHVIVNPSDNKAIQVAFFKVNAVISSLLLITTLVCIFT
jgi:4-hydroxybenzoate polyprenyltransferase